MGTKSFFDFMFLRFVCDFSFDVHPRFAEHVTHFTSSLGAMQCEKTFNPSASMFTILSRLDF